MQVNSSVTYLALLGTHQHIHECQVMCLLKSDAKWQDPDISRDEVWISGRKSSMLVQCIGYNLEHFNWINMFGGHPVPSSPANAFPPLPWHWREKRMPVTGIKCLFWGEVTLPNDRFTTPFHCEINPPTQLLQISSLSSGSGRMELCSQCAHELWLTNELLNAVQGPLLLFPSGITDITTPEKMTN